MDKKKVQIVIVLVCFIAAAAFLAYSMGVFGGGSPTPKSNSAAGRPVIEPAQSQPSK